MQERAGKGKGLTWREELSLCWACIMLTLVMGQITHQPNIIMTAVKKRYIRQKSKGKKNYDSFI